MLLPHGRSVAYTFNHARQKWQGSLADLDIEIGGRGVGEGAHLDVDIRGAVRKKNFWTMWRFDRKIRGLLHYIYPVQLSGLWFVYLKCCRFCSAWFDCHVSKVRWTAGSVHHPWTTPRVAGHTSFYDFGCYSFNTNLLSISLVTLETNNRWCSKVDCFYWK